MALLYWIHSLCGIVSWMLIGIGGLHFKSLLTSRQPVEYIVLDVEVVSSEVNVVDSKYALADVQVARVSDFGKNDTIFSVRTHLGHLLNPGDYALGYDLYGANNNDIEPDKYKGLILPETILIKKLKSLDIEVDNGKGRADQKKMDNEYEQFLRDLKVNPESRFNISFYRDRDYQPSEIASVTDGGDLPSVPLEELLVDLDLSDEENNDDMRE